MGDGGERALLGGEYSRSSMKKYPFPVGRKLYKFGRVPRKKSWHGPGGKEGLSKWRAKKLSEKKWDSGEEEEKGGER